MVWPFGNARAQRSRERAASRMPDGPVRTFLQTPAPDAATPLEQLPAVAVDMETTGLDPAGNAIVSIGWVFLDGLEIRFAGARHLLVAGEDLGEVGVGQSATIHGLTDDRLAGGERLPRVLEQLLEAMTGRVMIAHFTDIETGFLAAATERLWGVRFAVDTIDTMVIQRRIIAPGFDDEPSRDDLRLWRARSRFGLPPIKAHDALHDALACAELYLAQVAELGDTATTLKSVRS